MNCRYCRASNSEDDHRCHRCGRRLHLASPRPAPEPYPVIRGSAAPEIRSAPKASELQVAERPLEVVRSEEPPSGPRVPVQASLFGPSVVRPEETARPSRPERKQAPRPAVRRPAKPVQERMEFMAPAPARPLRTSVEAVIFSEQPVAPAAIRLFAAALDVSMILFGFALFLLTAYAAGFEFVWDTSTIPVYALAPACIGVLYKLLWIVAGGDTPGTRWTGLRLVNFDGHAPTRQQRLWRFLGGLFGVASAMLGILWALVDEEKLTWHDQISRTFPTGPIRR